MDNSLKILILSILLLGNPLIYADEKGERISATYFDLNHHRKYYGNWKLRIHGYTNSEQIEHTLECNFGEVPLSRLETVGIFSKWLEWHKVAVKTRFAVEKPLEGWESRANFSAQAMAGDAFTWMNLKHPKAKGIYDEASECPFSWKLKADVYPIEMFLIGPDGYEDALKNLKLKITKHKLYSSDDPYK